MNILMSPSSFSKGVQKQPYFSTRFSGSSELEITPKHDLSFILVDNETTGNDSFIVIALLPFFIPLDILIYVFLLEHTIRPIFVSAFLYGILSTNVLCCPVKFIRTFVAPSSIYPLMV